MTEKLFMACEENHERSNQFGPFDTAHEAEMAAQQIGWEWVMVSSREVDEFGTVMNTSTRFYQPDSLVFASPMDDVDELRRKLAPLHEDVTPMNDDERVFFARYEDQMEEPTEHEVKDWTKDSRMGATIRRMMGV